MSSPRYPDRDLRLERLGDRDGWRPANLGEAALVSALGSLNSARQSLAAYRALIDAVFTAPGAVEWLRGLQLRFVPTGTGRDTARQDRTPRDAVRPADPGPGRV